MFYSFYALHYLYAFFTSSIYFQLSEVIKDATGGFGKYVIPFDHTLDGDHIIPRMEVMFLPIFFKFPIAFILTVDIGKLFVYIPKGLTCHIITYFYTYLG